MRPAPSNRGSRTCHDDIGMSGLSVESTVIMKENLEELNARALSCVDPVILGGAALTRAYVEQDLHEIYDGEVRHARDAFEGLRLMDAMMGIKRDVPHAVLPELKQRRVRRLASTVAEERPMDEGRVRSEFGFAGQDPGDMRGMFALRYRGARFSLGYGACPDLEDRAKITDLLRSERIGVRLSEEFRLHPEQSTDAIVTHHPEAKYFNAGGRK